MQFVPKKRSTYKICSFYEKMLSARKNKLIKYVFILCNDYVYAFLKFTLLESMVQIVAIIAHILCTDFCVLSIANIAEIHVIMFLGVEDQQQVVEYFQENN